MNKVIFVLLKKKLLLLLLLLLLLSGLKNPELNSRNSESRIQVPLKRIRNSIPQIRNPQREVHNPRLCWITVEPPLTATSLHRLLFFRPGGQKIHTLTLDLLTSLQWPLSSPRGGGPPRWPL